MPHHDCPKTNISVFFHLYNKLYFWVKVLCDILFCVLSSSLLYSLYREQDMHKPDDGEDDIISATFFWPDKTFVQSRCMAHNQTQFSVVL